MDSFDYERDGNVQSKMFHDGWIRFLLLVSGEIYLVLEDFGSFWGKHKVCGGYTWLEFLQGDSQMARHWCQLAVSWLRITYSGAQAGRLSRLVT